MAYTSMKKLIENQNRKLAEGLITKGDYDVWKEKQMPKLDIFLTTDRLSETQYAELVNMFQ